MVIGEVYNAPGVFSYIDLGVWHLYEFRRYGLAIGPRVNLHDVTKSKRKFNNKKVWL